LEADISIWQKTGHFYFALTRRDLRWDLQNSLRETRLIEFGPELCLHVPFRSAEGKRVFRPQESQSSSEPLLRKYKHFQKDPHTADSAMPVLGEGGVVGNLSFEWRK